VEKIYKIRFIPGKFFLNGNMNPPTAAVQVLLPQGRWNSLLVSSLQQIRVWRRLVMPCFSPSSSPKQAISFTVSS